MELLFGMGRHTDADRIERELGGLPGERARHGLGWWAAQDTWREKKTPKPFRELQAGGATPLC
ncbi:hypothetical protein [Streptomyces sp. NPDC018000]|uniref:hypothetical protein n=1 Tax=Streptomyces sp. NPDC018000 TaxID=3365028 RepID=UPI0037AE6A02